MADLGGHGREDARHHDHRDEGDCVRVRWVLRDALPSPTFAKAWQFGPLTDHYRETHFTPPGILRVDLAAVDAGRRQNEGVRLIVTHCVTPETEASLHEFTLHSRNFALTDAKVDAHFEQQHKVIIEEDGWMLNAIQRRMSEPRFAQEPVLFNVDTGAVKVRRVMERLIAAEAH